MKRMVAAGVVAAVLAGGAALLGAGAEPPRASAGVELSSAVFAPFGGEWEIEGAWSDGTPLRARNVYEWRLGEKHMHTATFLPREDGGEVQRYDGFLTWNPARGVLVCYSFAVDGGVSEYLVELEGEKTFKFGFGALEGLPPPYVRQTITFMSDDAFRWVVDVKGEKGWERVMDGVWRRRGA